MTIPLFGTILFSPKSSLDCPIPRRDGSFMNIAIEVCRHVSGLFVRPRDRWPCAKQGMDQGRGARLASLGWTPRFSMLIGSLIGSVLTG